MLRRTGAILGLMLLTPALAQESIALARGGSRTIELTENPSTGYAWRIDRAASAGLDRVAIEDKGHRRGKNLPGAPGTHVWVIHALKPGQATIHFAYQRPWEPEPVETREIILDVAK